MSEPNEQKELYAHLEIRIKDYLKGTPTNRQILDWLEDHLAKELDIWGIKVLSIHATEISGDSVL